MKVLLTESKHLKSDLLKYKFSTPSSAPAYTSISRKGIKRKANKKYYKQNKVLNQWLKWKDIAENEKLLLALEVDFENYVLWNHKTLEETPIFESMYRACKGGSRRLVDLIINEIYSRKSERLDHLERNWNKGLSGACKGGNIELVNLMIAKGANNWNLGLRSACKGGNAELANLMISKGAKDWDSGLFDACRGGNIELVNLMIEKGATYWDNGLRGACQGTNKEIVELMITKGATKISYGISSALYYRQTEILELLIEKDITAYRYIGLEYACSLGSLKLAKSIIAKGADNLNVSLQAVCYEGEDTKEAIEIVELLISKGADNFEDALVTIAVNNNCCKAIKNKLELQLKRNVGK